MIFVTWQDGLMCLHACVRCDVSEKGTGGPPCFAAEWASRREDLGIDKRSGE